jgi:hypothetical protein
LWWVISIKAIPSLSSRGTTARGGPSARHYHFRYLINGEWHAEFQAGSLAMLAEVLPPSLLNLV